MSKGGVMWQGGREIRGRLVGWKIVGEMGGVARRKPGVVSSG